ncbi:undecaprenyl/decaprenyl-phosphate alpha-N-acetylglucosaminyl 1-phosphate transferase [Arenibacter aquaticus]|uniref:Undecaprenyl/decaprenyl-phosphate alpha-N-acetylglucosaminyl 1-phosphate transferase n=1 Tax=Arenibacter aquaticus TaxID=2489054 RepID=A0A430JYD3_9FLAO|nr:MraY family glycosyltransferase [Arenibacter aquaticus]RTE51735.1 undecaprenyl/decaprenyl-phosphate alpha-N-acetylglucosaminyl 1-phosphate transferase [Arenibacter aquaticus]
MAYLYDLFTNRYFLALTAIFLPLLLSLRLYPVIILLVRSKNLMDEPVDRSTHTSKTPTLGGVAIFIAYSISLILLTLMIQTQQGEMARLLAILGATNILMFLGIKDDLIGLSPKKKFSIQFFAAAIIVFATDLRIVSFFGLFGLYELPYIISVLFTIFVFILVINAFNLIDGIDGLAGSVGIISSLAFAYFSFLNGRTTMLLVSLVLVGSLIGFLIFNISKNRKIFMGDSGSMFVGFLLAYQAISLMDFHSFGTTATVQLEAPIMAMAILSYPLLDTLRVFIIRISQKRSPFSADRNHIHHKLLDLGLSHKKASLTIVGINITIIALAYGVQDLNINLQLFILLLCTPLFYIGPWQLRNRGRNSKQTMSRKRKLATFRAFLNSFLG